ncbi:MAG: right-handed parallel beta-helix repeat-containing protein [Candidatus Aegiribacteria sp.]|nr:right-handed parallel beta-helix repeat-containing protein [Candidatus Aegiribacteria sp.]
MKRLRVVAMLILCIALPSAGFAQTELSGPQSGTLGPGTYYVIGDVSVQLGDTLEIVPGTEFLHDGNHTWIIQGLLTAQGSMGDSIKFVRQDTIQAHRWGGLRFQSSASPDCILDYCVIDHVYIPSSHPVDYHGGGIYIYEVDLTILNSRISNCLAQANGGGIYAKDAAITIDNCLIIENEEYGNGVGGGISLYNCDGALITHSIIAYNSSGGT